MDGKNIFPRVYFLLTPIVFGFIFSLNIFAQQAKPGAIPIWSKGSENAKVTMEVFNDYQCPSCAAFNEKVKAVESKFPNDVRVIYRHFPLPMHAHAMLAAQAVEAAGMQTKFWQMSDLIFERHWKWSAKKSAREIFISYARKLGLNVKQFKSDLESPAVKDRIEADIERARSLKVSGTPTVILNGKELGVAEWNDLERIIKENLNE